MSVCLVRTDHLGDLLLMTPLIRAIAKGGGSVACVCRAANLPAFAGNPHVTESHAIEQVGCGFERSPWRLAYWMRRRGFDAYVLPLPHPSALIWAGLLGGSRRRLTAGGGIWSRICGYEMVKTGLPAVPRYYAEAHLDFARALGFPSEGCRLDWFVQDEERDWAETLIRARSPGGSPLIGIHPGSGGNTCNLPAREYGRLAALLLEQTDATVIVTGGPGEIQMTDQWDPGVLQSPRLINSVGKLTLRQLGALIEQMRVLVAPSTGPLHIAAALGTRTVSPFCERLYLRPAVWGNPNENSRYVSPRLGACESWASANRGFCDFRDEVKAEDLLKEIVSK